MKKDRERIIVNILNVIFLITIFATDVLKLNVFPNLIDKAQVQSLLVLILLVFFFHPWFVKQIKEDSKAFIESEGKTSLYYFSSIVVDLTSIFIYELALFISANSI